MNTGIYTLVAGLIVAAVSALAWLAYHHHKTFPRLISPVVGYMAGIYVFIALGTIALIYGATHSLVEVLDTDPNRPLSKVSYAIEELTAAERVLLWATIIGGGLIGYLLLLLYLPKILELDQGKPDSPSKKPRQSKQPPPPVSDKNEKPATG